MHRQNASFKAARGQRPELANCDVRPSGLCFESIQCDHRHCDVTILHLHEVDRRSFGEWSMAFGGIDGVSCDQQLLNEGMSPADGTSDIR